ncbi:MAG: glycosyltransferase [Propionicimonas sp.]|uniref:glycosyltransferase n=1 Tax=Propionicimonas sp. TaxID=1955623 RepID=UPI003D0D8A35
MTFGNHLLATRQIDAGALMWARAEQEVEGGGLGRHLVMQGALTPDQMYAALADYWGVPLVDLDAEPPDGGQLASAGLTTAEWQRWIPWRRDEHVQYVATCVRPDEELVAEVSRCFRDVRVEFRVATDAQIQAAVQRELREEHLFEISEGFASRAPDFSAKQGLALWQKIVPVGFVVLSVVGLLLDWRLALIVLLTVANVAFTANASFKVISTVFRPFTSQRSRRIARAERKELTARGLDADDLMARAIELPVYTILVPVYQEANVIGKIIENLESLHYPRWKLDVLVLLEENDTETIEAARAANPPPYVRLLIVPDGQPRTKPRACNYGLLFARGEYVVIFDAEDRPDPDQLLNVLSSFRHDAEFRSRHAPPLACLQAALNYYNADYNVLTRMFAIEYAHWFDSMLPGMDTTDIPIPLGGTSNHFLLKALVEAGAWDPWNVTEDADLGLRLAASRYRVDVVKSTTWEEATAKIGPWIRQRTRWIKGYIITAAVNLRHPVKWVEHNGWKGLVTMGGLILGTPMAFLFYPLMLGFTLFAWLIGPVFPIALPAWLLVFGTINMLGFNALMVIVSGLAAWRRYNWRIAIFAFFVPIYWLLHSWAAWRAAIQVARDPHRWEKTPHGLTEEYDDGIIDTGGLPHSAAS